MGSGKKEEPGGVYGKRVTVSCSICLELVKDNGERSTAKLQCGHQFHLDCIGSAFNAKGIMQCPNCRKIEKGQWLYANGHQASPEVNMEDVALDEDLHELGFSETRFGVQWCPIDGLTRLTSLEEGESTAAAYHDLLGRGAIPAEYTTASSAIHTCPYLSYFQQVQASSSLNPADNVSNSPTFHQWGGLSGPIDILTSHAFPVDLNHHSWDPHSPPFSSTASHINGAEQAPVSLAMLWPTRADSDGAPRTGVVAHQFSLGHGSTSRVGSSVTPIAPSFLGNSGGHPHNHNIHSFHQASNSTSMRTFVFSSSRRSNGPRGLVLTGSVPSSDHPGVHAFPSNAEINGGSQNFSWERECLLELPVPSPDCEQSWFRQFHPVASGDIEQSRIQQFHQVPGGTTDSNNRAGFWLRHGTERQSSQVRMDNSSYQSVQLPRMHPFI